MRPPYVALAPALLAFAVLGCDGGDGPPLDSYFVATPYANHACNSVDQALAGERQMRLYVKGSVSLLPITQGLASYYHRHSLSFFTETAPQSTTMSYGINTNTNEISRALVAKFPGVDLSDEEALMNDNPALYDEIITFVANFVLKPMIDFANAHSDAGGAVTNLILVPDVQHSGGEPTGDPGSTLAGLAISPALLVEFARSGEPEAALWANVNLPDNFTPMMVLGSDILSVASDVDPVLDDLIASHEFGHTGALVHSPVEGNLMYPTARPGVDGCTDSLDETQLETMRTAYGLGTAASAPLLANRAGAVSPPAPPARAGAALAPERLRALLAGDRRVMRSFVERLFHARAGAL